jgi:hypothetical protein
MAIVQAVANSFKKEILEGIHDLESGGDHFQISTIRRHSKFISSNNSISWR